MTTSVQESAKIIPFPVGGRKAAAVRREIVSAANAETPRVSGAAVGGAWYHDAAIQDSKRAGER